MTRTVFHRKLPRAVKSTKVGIGIRSTPAGTLIRLRKIGIIRPKKMAFMPCFWNHFSVFSRSETFTRGSRSHRAYMRSRPKRAPIQYRATAPTTDPRVVQNRAENRLITPCPAAKPVSGRMTSLGSGGKRFSRAIANPAPGPPRVSTRPVAHPAMPPVGSDARGM